MEPIKQALHKQRPNLSPSSVRTYCSILSNAYRKVYPEDKTITISKFDNDEEFNELLKGMNAPATLLSALYVITDNKAYQKHMTEEIQRLKAVEYTQTKNEKQQDSMISIEEVKDVLDHFTILANHVYRIEDYSSKGLNHLVNYILLCLTSGIYIEPRRSLDWCEMVVNKAQATDNDNYYDATKGVFVFNVYKTAKVYKQQVIQVPKDLKVILNKWLKVNPTKYMLFNQKQEKLVSPNIATRLNEIFGKKISTSALRHIFISDKYKNMPSLESLQETASKLGNSVPQMLQYIKK
jgi:hypothetical protein